MPLISYILFLFFVQLLASVPVGAIHAAVQSKHFPKKQNVE